MAENKKINKKEETASKAPKTPEVDHDRAVRATSKTVRLAARKARIVLDLIRGKNAKEAIAILEFTPNAGSEPVLKTLKSAMANATNNHHLDRDKLFVSECYANEGVTLKRFRPRAKGSASPIMKRTSHISVVVKEGKE